MSALMMGTAESLTLELEAEPMNVGVARAAVADYAGDLGLCEPELGDVKTAVSEACSNVVRHAYPGGSGRFELEASPVCGRLLIVVRDFGQGMRARVRNEGTTKRLGLGLISMLSTRFEIAGGDEGTEIRMQFRLPS